MKTIITILILLMLTQNIISQTAYAQESRYEFKKSAQQYTVTGSITITQKANEYQYATTIQNLPATKPGGGRYYILWGLTYENKAENLGTISNDTKKTGVIKMPIKQFFISSEKEQFPEFVSGPRIAQTDILPQTIFSGTSPTPSPTAAPTTKETPKKTSTPTQTPATIKGPTGSPETGLGGAILWNGLIYSLGALGITGLTVSVFKKIIKK